MEQANDFFNALLDQGKNMNVAKIVEIVSFKPDTMSVDVLPLPSEDNSIVLNVPIATVRTKDHLIYYPFREGDKAVVLFIDNDSDDILLGGDGTQTERQHDVSDAICIGGITLFTETLTVEDPENLCIQNMKNTANIVIKEDGDIKINAKNIIMKAEQNIKLEAERIDLN